jgi:hypothetical protein
MIDELLRVVFRDWHERAGVFSAQPNAPVVPDPPRSHRLAHWARTIRARLGHPRDCPLIKEVSPT